MNSFYTMENNVKNPIPVESYEEIFYQLRNDIKALHSCIFVNRFFCQLAIPLLWSTPFNHLDNDYSKAPRIIDTYICSLVDEDKFYLSLSGIPIGSPNTPFFPYPEYLTSFDSQTFLASMDKWLRKVDPLNYSTNYQSKMAYASYIVSNLLFGSTTVLESLRYFRFNPDDEMFFIKHKEFAYSISKLVILDIEYNIRGNNSGIHSEENKLNELFDTLSYYTHSVRTAKIKITARDDVLFTKNVIKSISNFISHQFNMESLSFNESLISENLSEFEKIINSQSNLKYLEIRGKLKHFTRVLNALRNCINLELFEFGSEKEVVREDYMQVDYYDYDSRGGDCEEIGEVGEACNIEEFDELKIKNIHYIEDCTSAEEEYGGCIYDEQQQQQQYSLMDVALEQTLRMTNVNIRTLNLGRINSTVIRTLAKYCYKLSHLSCELSPKDFSLFTKFLEMLKELEHLKLKLQLSPIINGYDIVLFANSLSYSLQKLGLNIYNDEVYYADNISYFLKLLLENLKYSNLSELGFYNDQMISDDNLLLVLNFASNALNRNEFGGNFKLFKYVGEDFNVDFSHTILRNGREIIQIKRDKVSDFYHPFYKPLYYVGEALLT